MLLCALLNLLLMRETSDGWLCHQKLQSVHDSRDSLVCSVTSFSFILNGTNFTQLPLNVSYRVKLPSTFPPLLFPPLAWSAPVEDLNLALTQSHSALLSRGPVCPALIPCE